MYGSKIRCFCADYPTLLHFSVWVSMGEIIAGHCDVQYNGSLILLPYLGHTIVSSDTLHVYLALTPASPTLVCAALCLTKGRSPWQGLEVFSFNYYLVNRDKTG